MVQVLKKDKLSGRTDTALRAHLGLNDEVRPAWRALYKPPITKRVGDLQQRILHGIVAVNVLVSVINPNVSEKCPFCSHRLLHRLWKTGLLVSAAAANVQDAQRHLFYGNVHFKFYLLTEEETERSID